MALVESSGMVSSVGQPCDLLDSVPLDLIAAFDEARGGGEAIGGANSPDGDPDQVGRIDLPAQAFGIT
jgi:hypothetical protein